MAAPRRRSRPRLPDGGWREVQVTGRGLQAASDRRQVIGDRLRLPAIPPRVGAHGRAPLRRMTVRCNTQITMGVSRGCLMARRDAYRLERWAGEFEIDTGNWKPKTASWKPQTGNWELETLARPEGRPEAGSGKRQAGRRLAERLHHRPRIRPAAARRRKTPIGEESIGAAFEGGDLRPG